MGTSFEEDLRANITIFCDQITPLVESGLASFEAEEKPDLISIRRMDTAALKLVKFCRRQPQLFPQIDWDQSVLPDESTYKVINHLLRMRLENNIRDIAFIRLAVSWINGRDRR